MLLRCVVLFAILALVVRGNTEFKVTEGCRQYNSTQGYNFRHRYYATSNFKNHNYTREGIKKMRLGVYAKKGHAFIRLAPVPFTEEYAGVTMHEIVFTGRKIFARRYKRKNAKTVFEVNNLIDVKTLKEVRSSYPSSSSRPVMFSISIRPGKSVQLAKSFAEEPFLQFNDEQNTYYWLSFANTGAPAVFYYDCPLEGKPAPDYPDDDDDDEDYADEPSGGSGDGARPTF